PILGKVVFEDPRGMRGYLDDGWFMSWDDLLARGAKLHAEEPHLFAEHVAQGKPDDVCHFSTTSGTTGRPKAAMLTHRNYLSMAYALHQIDPILEGDDYVSFLPFAWIVEQVFALALPLLTGMVVNFPESSETAMDDLREIGPHMMLGAPRVWEGVQSQIWVRLEESYPLNRWAYKRLMNVGRKAADYRMKGKALPPALALAYRFAHFALFRPLKDQLGFLRLRRAYTGGAALGPDTFRLFQGMGVNLKQVYGQTEICGIAVLHRDDDVRFATVGTPLPGTDLHVADDGEILLRSVAVFAGYHRNPEATAQAMTADGWLRTGDAGYIDDGHLVVIDRAKDVLQAADGTRFSPAFVENKLKFSQYVEEAVVFGGGDLRYVTAMITIDMDTVGTWAEREKLSYTTYTDLAQREAVYALVAAHIARANADLPEGARVRRFVLLHKQLDADDEELTRTRKVRRSVISDRYGEIIDALYTDADSVTITATVTYQDGSTVKRSIPLALWSMDDVEPPEPVRPGQLVWSSG
ncbi:MAG: AMP-binding protein, partial [Egibacteraceae bacterium]